MNKKNIGIVSLIISILSLIPLIFEPSSLNGIMLFIVIGIVLAVIGVILGFVGKKTAKGSSIAGIIIGAISFFVLCLTLIGLNMIKNAKDCVLKDNGMASCKIYGAELETPASYLSEEQISKGE